MALNFKSIDYDSERFLIRLDSKYYYLDDTLSDFAKENIPENERTVLILRASRFRNGSRFGNAHHESGRQNQRQNALHRFE